MPNIQSWFKSAQHEDKYFLQMLSVNKPKYCYSRWCTSLNSFFYLSPKGNCSCCVSWYKCNISVINFLHLFYLTGMLCLTNIMYKDKIEGSEFVLCSCYLWTFKYPNKHCWQKKNSIYQNMIKMVSKYYFTLYKFLVGIVSWLTIHA